MGYRDVININPMTQSYVGHPQIIIHDIFPLLIAYSTTRLNNHFHKCSTPQQYDQYYYPWFELNLLIQADLKYQSKLQSYET